MYRSVPKDETSGSVRVAQRYGGWTSELLQGVQERLGEEEATEECLGSSQASYLDQNNKPAWASMSDEPNPELA